MEKRRIFEVSILRWDLVLYVEGRAPQRAVSKATERNAALTDDLRAKRPTHRAAKPRRPAKNAVNTEELLADVRRILESEPDQSSLFGVRSKGMLSVRLIEKLWELPGGKWRGLNAISLARALKPAGIRPHSFRMGEKVGKGYGLAAFGENNSL